MAKVVGAYFTSHVPSIGGAIFGGKQQDPYWKPFFDGYPRSANGSPKPARTSPFASTTTTG